MIDVEVREEDGVELGYVRAGASELQGAAAATVDEDSRAAILPDEIAAGGTVVFQLGPAGPQNLELDAFVRASARVAGERKCHQGEGQGQGRWDPRHLK